MPDLLTSDEVAMLSETGRYSIEFEYHGADVCSSCHSPDYLYVPKSVILPIADDSEPTSPKCALCIHNAYERMQYQGIWDSLTTEQAIRLQVAKHDLKRMVQLRYSTEMAIDENQFCHMCASPIIEGHHLYSKFKDYEVRNPDNLSVVVHEHCGIRAIACHNCDNHFTTNLGNYASRMLYGLPTRLSENYQFTQIDDETHCRPCADEILNDEDVQVYTCYQCEEFFTDDATPFDGDSYCSRCYEDYIYYCGDCNEGYHANRGHDCYYENEDDDYSNSFIHNYSYKPAPEFFGNARYFMGFELEVECGPRANKFESAEQLQSKLGARAYLKEDGSLDNGYEVVTHPHTLESYNREFDWTFLEWLKKQGLRSWNTSSCGLHVHVSRTAFDPIDSVRLSYSRSERILKRQAHELRFTKLIYDNQRQVERIAGRSSHFSSFSDKGNLIHKIKHGNQEDGRYSAVNTENHATLEVRVFKGSLRPERVRSALEFVHAAVEYTRDMKVAGKNNCFAWSKFVAFVVTNESTYPNLLTIINETFANDNIQD